MNTICKLTPRERAESLLRVMEGECSVSIESELAKPFLDMEAEGLVKITPTTGFFTGQKLYNVYAKPTKVCTLCKGSGIAAAGEGFIDFCICSPHLAPK